MPKQTLVAIIATLLILGLAAWAYSIYEGKETTVGVAITNFGECVAAGYPVMESYPRQCAANGQTFVEDIGNQQDENELIRVSQPRANAMVVSPLHIEGEARGSWFFEAQFPVQLLDDQDRLLATGVARAQGDWQTEDFVPFELDLEFTVPTAERGTLVLKNDNPSGLPENDKEIRIPVFFEKHNGEEDPDVSSIRLDYNQLTLSEQEPSNFVYVESAVIVNGGFVVIHTSVDGQAGPAIGHSRYINRSGATQVIVNLSRELHPGETVFALLHEDNGDGRYTSSGDLSILNDNMPISVAINVRELPATVVASNE